MQHNESLKQTMLNHAALQQRSGNTIPNYAKLIGVSRYKMQYWVRQYKAGQIIQENKTDSSLKFINLESFGHQHQPISDKPSTSQESTTGNPSLDEPKPQITLSFPNGMCLKIY